MGLRKNSGRAVLGLDLGAGAVKVVHLRLSDQHLQLVGERRLSAAAEGILDDNELRESLLGLVKDAGWRGFETCSGLAQYLTTVQVRDFPDAPTVGMEKMIAFETRHLSGMSEDNFLTDYAVMAPGNGRQNPILIGTCRESAVLDRVDLLRKVELTPAEIGMNSLAAMNTLYALHPDQLESSGRVQILLDIGADSSTVVFFAGSQVLFTSSLILGGERFTREYADLKGLDLSQAEEAKRACRIDAALSDSPLLASAMELKQELEGVIEQWQGQEIDALRKEPISGLWLCGGVAKQPGLAEYLAEAFSCPAQVFGPAPEPGEKGDPELAVAYGLALQAMDIAALPVSLAPRELRWATLRRQHFHFLAVALVIIFFAICLIMLTKYSGLIRENRYNRVQISRLEQCKKLIPELDKQLEEIRHHERMLLPFVIKGSNAVRYLNACREISSARSNEAFFIYLADEGSFREVDSSGGRKKSNPVSKPFFNIFSKGTVDSSRGTESGLRQMTVEELDEPTSYILAGYTLTDSKQAHYDLVRGIQEQLDKSLLFSNAGEKVDLLPEHAWQDRADIFELWKKYIINSREIRNRLRRHRLREFVLRLPIAEPNVKPEAFQP